MINEVESNPDPDYVELYNRGPAPVDIAGWIMRDNNNANGYTFAAGTTIAAGAYLVISNPPDFTFGLGGGDEVRLFNSTGTLVDSHTWTAHAGGANAFSRCPNGTGTFAERPMTRNAVNDCTP